MMKTQTKSIFQRIIRTIASFTNSYLNALVKVPVILINKFTFIRTDSCCRAWDGAKSHRFSKALEQNADLQPVIKSRILYRFNHKLSSLHDFHFKIMIHFHTRCHAKARWEIDMEI